MCDVWCAEKKENIEAEACADVEAWADGEDKRAIDIDSLAISYSSDNTSAAIVDSTGLVKAVGAGVANITVNASLNGISAEPVVITLDIKDDGLVGISASAIPRLIRPDSEGTKITVEGGTYLGKKLDLTNQD